MRSGSLPAARVGKVYVSMVRGVPDIIFFLFVPIAIDQLVEYILHRSAAPTGRAGLARQRLRRLRRGEGAAVRPRRPGCMTCGASRLAVTAFALVFGAFAANTLHGAMQAVPRAQIETAEAYGMTRAQAFRRVLLPQMWVYALPGLSNLWMILTKATPLLFLLGIQDIVYWARELGGAKTSLFAYPHPDWRVWYFLACWSSTCC
jgi:polar amino acid transport system permease protein